MTPLLYLVVRLLFYHTIWKMESKRLQKQQMKKTAIFAPEINADICFLQRHNTTANAKMSKTES
ncbi:MAG: hypothetical protein PUC59_09115 [Firmicutes bacterium]|nr:hypothetical protein [Bacillota bacterium]